MIWSILECYMCILNNAAYSCLDYPKNDSRGPEVLAADGAAVLDMKVEELELDVGTTTTAADVILK